MCQKLSGQFCMCYDPVMFRQGHGNRDRGIKFTRGAGEGFTMEVILSYVLKD